MDGTRSDQNLRPRPTPVRALASSLSISRVSDAYATLSLSSSISSPCIITQARHPWPRTCSPNGVHNRRPCVQQQKLQEEEEAGSIDFAARNQLTVCVCEREVRVDTSSRSKLASRPIPLAPWTPLITGLLCLTAALSVPNDDRLRPDSSHSSVFSSFFPSPSLYLSALPRTAELTASLVSVFPTKEMKQK